MKNIGLLFCVALSLSLLLSWTSSNEIGTPVKSLDKISSSAPKDVHFVATGDWSCNLLTKNTVSSIQSKNPDLVLALGDFSYQKGTGCWFNIMSPLLNKTKIVIGEHDFDANKNTSNDTRLMDYVNRFNLTNPYYSFNHGNVHFLAMSSIIPFSNQTIQYRLLRDESNQHDFISNDLMPPPRISLSSGLSFIYTSLCILRLLYIHPKTRCEMYIIHCSITME